MSFIYFEDTDGDYTIINHKHLVFVDIQNEGEGIKVVMDNGCSADVKKEMFSVEDFELALEGVEMLKAEKIL